MNVIHLVLLLGPVCGDVWSIFCCICCLRLIRLLSGKLLLLAISMSCDIYELVLFVKGKFEHSIDVVAVGCKFMF